MNITGWVRLIIGLGLMSIAIPLGIYVGGYLMFFKGIVSIVNGFTGDINAVAIALGFLKVLFGSLSGILTTLIAGIIGFLTSGIYNDL